MNLKETNIETVEAIVSGTVIDPANGIFGKLNVFIENGIISEISSREPDDRKNVIDAAGLYVVPGFVDIHTHLREPGFEYKEDIESGSRAAAAGGFTTILCMPNTKPVNDCASVTRRIAERAKDVGLVNILPVGAMSKGLEGRELSDIDGMISEGIVAFSDDGSCIQDENLMRRVMEISRDRDILVIDHPEDFSIGDGGRDAENNIIKRDIELAREIDTRLHVAHISTKEGIDFVRRAKGEGLPVTCEVTPHHLMLTEDDVERIGANAKMKPPLRTVEDRRALIDGLKDGTVDAIATDHAPHAAHEKKDLANAQFGVIGLETAFTVCMKLVEYGHISLERLIELFTSGPARVASLAAGTLTTGVAADISIFDPDTVFQIRAKLLNSKSSNTPFDGWRIKGRVFFTIVNGRVVHKAL